MCCSTAVIIPTIIVLVVSLWLIGDVLKFIITSNGDRLSLIIVIKLNQDFIHREPSPFSSSISHCLHLCIISLQIRPYCVGGTSANRGFSLLGGSPHYRVIVQRPSFRHYSKQTRAETFCISRFSGPLGMRITPQLVDLAATAGNCVAKSMSRT